MARLFGDENEVMVFSEDIVIDHNNHELTVKTHSKSAAAVDDQMLHSVEKTAQQGAAEVEDV